MAVDIYNNGTYSNNDWVDYTNVSRYSWYSQGRYWVFTQPNQYYNGSSYDVNIHYISSTNGVTWGNEGTQATGSDSSQSWRIDFKGNYVYLLYLCTISEFNPARYVFKRGLLNSDGTITWGSAQDPGLTSSVLYGTPNDLKVDSSGYPYIICQYDDFSTIIACKVTKSSTNDGTWSTASGYPLNIDSVSNITYNCYPLGIEPMASQNMYYYYFKGTDGSGNGSYLGKLWNGSSWGSAETIYTVDLNTVYGGAAFPKIVLSDTNGTLYVVYSYDVISSNYFYMVYKTRSTSWSAPTTIFTNGGTISYYSSLSYNSYNSTLYLLNGYTSFMKNVSGTWDAGWTTMSGAPSNYGYLPKLSFNNAETLLPYLANYAPAYSRTFTTNLLNSNYTKTLSVYLGNYSKRSPLYKNGIRVPDMLGGLKNGLSPVLTRKASYKRSTYNRDF
jgi:hypothetical protein